MPACRERRGLAARRCKALDAEARSGIRRAFHGARRRRCRTCCCSACRSGELQDARVGRHALRCFLQDSAWRRDIVLAYYAHPTAWSEIGWGGPASPRGYVRMDFDDAIPGKPPKPRTATTTPRAGAIAVSDDPLHAPRAAQWPRARRFRPGGWMPMRNIAMTSAVDFAIVGTGAGGGTLACKLAEDGFSVVALDAGPYFRPLEDFASDESEQTKLYWTDDRIVDGANPLQLGGNNSGKAVGGIDRAFRDGLAALPSGMVQVAHPAGLRRRLAARLARDVGLLHARSSRR